MSDPIPLLNQPKQDEPPQQPQGPQVGIQLTPQGLMIGVMPTPVNIQIGDEVMRQIVIQYLGQHPDFQDELIGLTVQAKQAQLQLIKDIKRSKIN